MSWVENQEWRKRREERYEHEEAEDSKPRDPGKTALITGNLTTLYKVSPESFNLSVLSYASQDVLLTEDFSYWYPILKDTLKNKYISEERIKLWAKHDCLEEHLNLKKATAETISQLLKYKTEWFFENMSILDCPPQTWYSLVRYGKADHRESILKHLAAADEHVVREEVYNSCNLLVEFTPEELQRINLLKSDRNDILNCETFLKGFKKIYSRKRHLASLLYYISVVRDKTTVRKLIKAAPDVINHVTVDIVNNSSLTPKQWVLILEQCDKSKKFKYADDIAEWLDQQITMDALAGTAKDSRYLKKARKTMKGA